MVYSRIRAFGQVCTLLPPPLCLEANSALFPNTPCYNIPFPFFSILLLLLLLLFLLKETNK